MLQICTLSVFLSVLVWGLARTSHTYVCIYTDSRDEDDEAPIHRACIDGDKDVVQYLIEEAKCDMGEYPKSCTTDQRCAY